LLKYREPSFSNTEIAFQSYSNLELKRAQGLFKLIHAPTLVKIGSGLLNIAMKLHLPVSPLVKWTVFQHFCGGESITDCKPIVKKLEQYSVKCILDFGAEGEKTEAGFDAAANEFVRNASDTSTNPKGPFIVFKATAIARFDLLEKISANGLHSLNQKETEEWRRVQSRIDRICLAAQSTGRPVMVDAEESWIQDAVDLEVLRQMKLRNTEHAWIYTTIQLYRIDRLDYLKTLHKIAQDGSFFVGVKLVRGAYMEKERQRSQVQGIPSPIHKSKEDSDRSYNQALEYCFEHSDRISVFVGTHNEYSCQLATRLLLKSPTPEKIAKVWFSQLFGMSDHLTFNLASAGFSVAKYVPYGPVDAVVPYLIRRAEENTAVAGQSGRELQIISSEIRRRATMKNQSVHEIKEKAR
jgi:proline dehydrogenase